MAGKPTKNRVTIKRAGGLIKAAKKVPKTVNHIRWGIGGGSGGMDIRGDIVKDGGQYIATSITFTSELTDKPNKPKVFDTLGAAVLFLQVAYRAEKIKDFKKYAAEQRRWVRTAKAGTNKVANARLEHDDNGPEVVKTMILHAEARAKNYKQHAADATADVSYGDNQGALLLETVHMITY